MFRAAMRDLYGGCGCGMGVAYCTTVCTIKCYQVMLPRSQGHWQFSSMVTNAGSFWTVAGCDPVACPPRQQMSSEKCSGRNRLVAVVLCCYALPPPPVLVLQARCSWHMREEKEHLVTSDRFLWTYWPHDQYFSNENENGFASYSSLKVASEQHKRQTTVSH